MKIIEIVVEFRLKNQKMKKKKRYNGIERQRKERNNEQSWYVRKVGGHIVVYLFSFFKAFSPWASRRRVESVTEVIVPAVRNDNSYIKHTWRVSM